MMTRSQTWILFFTLLAGTMLACNIPLSAPNVLPAPVTPTLSYEATTASTDSDVTPTRTSRPTRTPVPTDDPNEVTETETPLPTFTPISLAPTVTPEGEGSEENSEEESEEEATSQETTTAEPEFESLELQFVQTWQLLPDDPGFALASVVLTATGGDGEYTYFRDDQQQPGAEFEYRWRACVDNTGTFRVDSGDGQSVTADFSEESPCSP